MASPTFEETLRQALEPAVGDGKLIVASALEGVVHKRDAARLARASKELRTADDLDDLVTEWAAVRAADEERQRRDTDPASLASHVGRTN